MLTNKLLYLNSLCSDINLSHLFDTSISTLKIFCFTSVTALGFNSIFSTSIMFLLSLYFCITSLMGSIRSINSFNLFKSILLCLGNTLVLLSL